MSRTGQEILADALKLLPMERAELVEQILASFSFPDRGPIDESWKVEAEDRIAAYDQGLMKSRSAADVFDGIEHGQI